MDSMTFRWQAIPGEKVHEGRGKKYSSWDGTATESRKFLLEIREGKRAWLLTDSVTVRPRRWSLQERSAEWEYKPLPLSEEEDSVEVWGTYDSGGLDSLLDTSTSTRTASTSASRP